MSKVFNVAAVCIPEEHYMVNLDQRLKEIKELVDDRKYFTINRARQYGKTTTLRALSQYLQQDYYVVLMDFQTFGNAKFKDENTFSLSFASSFLRMLMRNEINAPDEFNRTIAEMKKCVNRKSSDFELKELFEILSDLCMYSDKPIVLMIDEVDSASNNQVFLDFLAQLRAYYIDRSVQPALYSVILAGVYDVRNLKRELRPEDDHKMNSSWNIAADFNIDMSFHEEEIAGMLRDYETDHKTGMDINGMARLLYEYTSGYPYLISRLCKLMDEDVSGIKDSKSASWTFDGFMEANRILVSENNTLFESLIGKIINYPELNNILKDKIFNGQIVAYTVSNPVISMASMFGIIKNADGVVVPANRIFAKVLSDYYLSLDEMKSLDIYKAALTDKNQFVDNKKLNMKLVMRKFLQHFTELYGNKEERFIEKEGRKYFLLYLRPIINGAGHYSMEAVTANDTRTDLIVYYHEEFFIIEMKVWHGEKAHYKSEQQLLGYMASYHQNTGYLLTFNFNKSKEQGMKEVKVNGNTLIEVTV